MIASLSGKISEKLINQVVVDVGGVGYGVFVTSEDYNRLNLDQPAKVYIYEYVREQAHDLFGFLERETKALFEKLLDVSGVGPRMALSILSVAPPAQVREAIASGNTSFIQQASGVGRRVAERVVVDLKDKVGLVGVDLEASGLLVRSGQVKDEAMEALVSLGFSTQDAQAALQPVDTSLPIEERVKEALKGATKTHTPKR